MKKNLYVFAILFTFPFIAASQTGQDSLTHLINKLANDLIKEKEAIGLSIGIFNNGKTSYYQVLPPRSRKPYPKTKPIS